MMAGMTRPRRTREIDLAGVAAQLGLLCLGLVVLATGSIGLIKLISTGVNIAASLAFTAAGVLMLIVVGRTIHRGSAETRSPIVRRPPGWTPPVFPRAQKTGAPFPIFSAAGSTAGFAPAWTPTTILTALGEIDWFQYERFCAALLRTEGYEVVRKNGARPDGGVDLVVEKGGERMLVQCKHWRTLTVKENAVRALLGSMTHFEVTRGTLYTLNGWTQHAADFAAAHAITLVDGEELSQRAVARLTPKQLDEVLNLAAHHCPKCEAPMVWREGNFYSYWGCSTFPRCRGTLKSTGAR
jgi:Holliday junction resolvase